MEEDFFNSLVKRCCTLTPQDLIRNIEVEIEKMRRGFGHSVWLPEWFLHSEFIGFPERKFDVIHDKDNIKIYLDVRDLDKDNIEINITKNYIEIEAEVVTDFEKKSYYQKISLEEEVDEKNADAKVDEGIL